MQDQQIIVGYRRREDKCRAFDCEYLERCPYGPGEGCAIGYEPIFVNADEAARMIEAAFEEDPPDRLARAAAWLSRGPAGPLAMSRLAKAIHIAALTAAGALVAAYLFALWGKYCGF